MADRPENLVPPSDSAKPLSRAESREKAAQELAYLDDLERRQRERREASERELERICNDPEVQRAFDDYAREYGEGDPTWWKPEFTPGEVHASERIEHVIAAPRGQVAAITDTIAKVVINSSAESRKRLSEETGVPVADLDALASSKDVMRKSQTSLRLADHLHPIARTVRASSARRPVPPEVAAHPRSALPAEGDRPSQPDAATLSLPLARTSMGWVGVGAAVLVLVVVFLILRGHAVEENAASVASSAVAPSASSALSASMVGPIPPAPPSPSLPSSSQSSAVLADPAPSLPKQRGTAPAPAPAAAVSSSPSQAPPVPAPASTLIDDYPDEGDAP
jgi:hypothetical protein